MPYWTTTGMDDAPVPVDRRERSANEPNAMSGSTTAAPRQLPAAIQGRHQPYPAGYPVPVTEDRFTRLETKVAQVGVIIRTAAQRP
jgi:hypothetical protein